MLLMCGTWFNNFRAASALAWVWASLVPGGSSKYTWVWLLSSGGMKPVGNKGTKDSEPIKNASAPSTVHQRCFKHHWAKRK